MSKECAMSPLFLTKVQTNVGKLRNFSHIQTHEVTKGESGRVNIN